METLACGHVAYAGESRVCAHMVNPAGSGIGGYVRLLTGRGLDADLCCGVCDERRQDGVAVALVEVCEGCVDKYADDEYGYLAGWRGEPGIAERPEDVDGTVTATPLPDDVGVVVDIAALATADGRSAWLVLDEGGHLVRFDADTGACERLAATSVPDEPDREPWAGNAPRRRLLVAPGGRFAAVVTDFGRHGQVFDLDRGVATLALDGGDYRPETVPLSFAFARHGGGVVAVHRTAWNRLDVSDPATGRPLTPRQSPSYERGEAAPEHYLDYFHGALHASPSGRWLADDGWVWAPVGIPTVWDLHRWLDTNPWESEDGPTRRALCHRDYHWNVPMCWIGDNLLAVSGIGQDDIAILPGVRLFDVGSGVELHHFAGPRGALFGVGRRLYAAAPGGLEIWDPFTGERTGRIPGFVPAHHHPTAGELAQVEDRTLRRWRIGAPSAA
ncbi:hypothetical protein [Phytohabitans houttuyneae]|uniref:Uncharacterized protein n=1 Tax=Phytohabitans houttuyneae TaxID=1076126 RepID=A0A6V8KQP6_9ACTN|nr:hypothetical protein [Phytohabitans houttuyneae]GFJ82935.1 hypothetical protein Phou_071150 [Phytohabitans houttuyneae]